MNQLNEIQSVDLLVFAPHPDDAELGTGGSILHWRSQGYRVGIVDLTRGELGTKGNAELRMREAAEAARLLDIHYRTNLDLGDGRLADNDAARHRVVEVIRRTRPRVLFTTCPFDRHPDHVAACELIRSALFLARLPKYETESAPHSVNGLFYYFIHDHTRPTFIIDISDFYEQKQRVLHAYQSQFVDVQLPEGYQYAGTSDYPAQVEAYDRNWGAKIGARYGEAFYSDRPFIVNDIGSLIR